MNVSFAFNQPLKQKNNRKKLQYLIKENRGEHVSNESEQRVIKNCRQLVFKILISLFPHKNIHKIYMAPRYDRTKVNNVLHNEKKNKFKESLEA